MTIRTAFAVAVFVSTGLFAQEPLLRTITVTGQAEMSVVADKATFSFSVLGLGSTLREAVDDAKTKTSTMVRALARVGIPQHALQTEDFVSGENADKAFLSSSRDFRARLLTLVTVDSLALLERAILTLSDNKPEDISNVSFLRTDLHQRRRDAQVAAVNDAKNRASRIAEALGVVVKEPLIVEAQSGMEPVFPAVQSRRSKIMGVTSESMDPSEPFIGAKNIIIKENVRIVFQY